MPPPAQESVYQPPQYYPLPQQYPQPSTIAVPQYAPYQQASGMPPMAPPVPKKSNTGTIVAAIVIIAIVLIAALAISMRQRGGSLSYDSDGDGYPDTVDYYPTDPTRHTQYSPSVLHYMQYAWSYGGYDWTWSLTISGSTYSSYRELSHTVSYASDYARFVTETDSYVVSIANALDSKASQMGYNDYETVSFIMAFIQSLPYTKDSVTTGLDEYPRYPVETLVDNGGDCEDTSILLAAIVEALNYDAVLLYMESISHMATGIWGSSGISGSYYTHDSRNYYYCETTGDGFAIGTIPTEFGTPSAIVIEV
jgi:hypothetical protein